MPILAEIESSIVKFVSVSNFNGRYTGIGISASFSNIAHASLKVKYCNVVLLPMPASAHIIILFSGISFLKLSIEPLRSTSHSSLFSFNSSTAYPSIIVKSSLPSIEINRFFHFWNSFFIDSKYGLKEFFVCCNWFFSNKELYNSVTCIITAIIAPISEGKFFTVGVCSP